MAYESSVSKKKHPKGGTSILKKFHGLSLDDEKLSDDRVGLIQSTNMKEKLLIAKPQYSGNAFARAPRTALSLAEVNELKGRKLKNRAGAIEAGLQGGQYRAIGSGNLKAKEHLTQTPECDGKRSALYTIRASPGKGLGMFATQNIQQGTRLLAEKPFFSFSKGPELSLEDQYGPNDITKAYNQLRAIDRLRFMRLHWPKRADCGRLVSTYESNCYEMGSGTCICLDASRINHSCLPNAHFSWNDNIERLTVHTVKDISEGEEISISYCPAVRTLNQRKDALKPYLFTCHCPACRDDTVDGIISQMRRQQMLDLDQEIADYQCDPATARAEHGHCDEQPTILRLISLLDKEGLVYEKSLAYHDAAEWALKQGFMEKALEYASKELAVDFCCVGQDSPSYQETKSFFLKIYAGTDCSME